MLNKAKTLTGYVLEGLDGEVGEVIEFYFDDHLWVVRYLVANTGNWLLDRKALISPYALGAANKKERYLTVNLTKKQIENSPPLKSDMPVSRQFEESYYEYYGWPVYWAGASMCGAYPCILPSHENHEKANSDGKAWDAHLRSTQEVSGYNIQAEDGELGHVEDFIIDDETWAVRYLLINTRNWWPGKKILISPQWIERVSWSESKVFLNLSRKTIKQSPAYSEDALLTREYEADLHRHYSRKGYWDEAKHHSL